MAAIAFANLAAALAAGYVETDLDRGAGYVPVSDRFLVRLEKPNVGFPGASGARIEACGAASTLGAAQTNAVTNLNNMRVDRYGTDDATGQNNSPLPDASSTPSSTTVVPTFTKTQKEKH